MRKIKEKKSILSAAGIAIAVIFAITGCKEYDNFTTYFNTYYNMERIMKESEMEFEYHDEQLRENPRVFVPEPDAYIPPDDSKKGRPEFCREFIVTRQKRRPVETKLDSILIKGSKIMARHPKSNYIEGSLYLMAQTFFIKEEWLPAQIKCGELIDKFPAGEYSPDAHLLMAKSLIIQTKFREGRLTLSRTVDIAWQLKRYDILSEAFRIEAELYLYEGDKERAFRPYKQAVIQTDDCELRAKWQLDLAALMYKAGLFEKALEAFREVHRYCPDYVRTFEAKLYEAECLARLGRYYEAGKILKKLDKDGKYEDWRDLTANGILNMHRLMVLDSNETSVSADSLVALETAADTTFPNNPAVGAYYFERAVDYYKDNKLREAREYFSKAKVAKSPVLYQANLMHRLLNKLDRKSRIAEHTAGTEDSTAAELAGLTKDQKVALDLYEVGRVYEKLMRHDSALVYYRRALEKAPKDDPETGKYYLTYSEKIREKDPYTADSLLEILIEDYTYTDYGEVAMEKLNFVVSLAIDTAGELYESGYQLYKHSQYRFAVSQFDSLYRTFPTSDFAPKALYTAGYIYEDRLMQYDTALYYYKRLVDLYPTSEYAKDITYTIDFKEVTDAGIEIPDSLKKMRVDTYKLPKKFEKPVFDPNLNPPSSLTPAQELSPRDMLKDPKSIFQKGRDLLSDPLKKLKDLKKKGKDIIDDPNKALKEINPLNNLDSLKKNFTPEGLEREEKKGEGEENEGGKSSEEEEKEEGNQENAKKEENEGEGK